MVFAVRRCCLFLAVVLTAATGDADLGAVATAAGHPARTHWRADVPLTSEGRSGTLTIEQQGVRRLQRRCIADVCTGVWFDGRDSFTFGLNDAPFRRTADDAEMRTWAAIASWDVAEPEFFAAGGTATLERRDGTRATWRVRARDGVALDATVDGATGAIAAITRPDGAAAAALGEPLSARNAERVDGPLEAPGTGTPQLGPTVDIPLGGGPQPIVPCRLGTRPLRCLIDTGTTPSAMTLALAEELRLEPHGEIEIAGFGRGRYATGIVDAGPLAVGNATFATWHFAVIPGARGFGFDVILGSDALATIRLTIDRTHRRARIEPARTDGAARGWPLTFAGDVPHATVALGGHELAALLDTGDSALLSIDYETLRREPALFQLSGTATSAGIGGSSDALEGIAPSVRVGSTEFGPAHVTVTRTQRGAHLGIGILTRCTLVLDFAQSRAECTAPSP